MLQIIIRENKAILEENLELRTMLKKHIEVRYFMHIKHIPCLYQTVYLENYSAVLENKSDSIINNEWH